MRLSELIKERLIARGYCRKEEKITKSYKYDSTKWHEKDMAFGKEPLPDENGDKVYEVKEEHIFIDNIPDDEALNILLLEQEKDIQRTKEDIGVIKRAYLQQNELLKQISNDVSSIQSIVKTFWILAIIAVALFFFVDFFLK